MTQNVVLSCDWFGLSMMLDGRPTTAPPLHQWVDYDGTNVWGRRSVLMNEYGEKVCTILYEPKSSIIHKDAALMEVANEWLYHGIGVQGITSLLYHVCPYRITGISRLDLAFDFVPTSDQWTVIRGLSQGSLYVSGKRNRTQFLSTCNDEWMPAKYRGKEIPHCQSWGHKTTAVKWKLYYKTKELRDAMGGMWMAKPYIVDQWRRYGLDENDVWRLEVSVHGCNQLMWDGIPMTYNRVSEYAQFMARDLYQQRFIIRKAQGHADKSNDDVVPFLPVSGYKHRIRCFSPEPNPDDNRHNGRIALLRRLVQAAEEPEVRYDTPSRRALVSHVQSLVRRDGLQAYFAAMVGKTLGEWCDELEGVGGGKYEVRDNVLIASGIQPNRSWDG